MGVLNSYQNQNVIAGPRTTATTTTCTHRPNVEHYFLLKVFNLLSNTCSSVLCPFLLCDPNYEAECWSGGRGIK